MRKIIGYQVITKTDIHELEQDVNARIRYGWEPLGAPIVPAPMLVLQAMVKRAPAPQAAADDAAHDAAMEDAYGPHGQG